MRFVEAEGKAEAAFREELEDLEHAFAGFAHDEEGSGGMLEVDGPNDGAVDGHTCIMVCKRLRGVISPMFIGD